MHLVSFEHLLEFRLQETHAVSHREALADAAVDSATSKAALHIKTMKRGDPMRVAPAIGWFILISWIGWAGPVGLRLS
jgi:hypothetical protein